ncbi:MAG: SRPBCC family protein [Flavipsychrobacter sp.]
MANKKQIVTSVIIHTNKEQVWDKLYHQFGDISIFNPNLDHSYQITTGAVQVGTERRCDLDANTYIKETITHADEYNSMSIDIYDGNMPMLNTMDINIKLNPLSNSKTEIILIANFNTKPTFMAGLMKLPLRKKMTDLLIGLKYYLETGNEVSKHSYKPILKAFKQLPINQPFI